MKDWNKADFENYRTLLLQELEEKTKADRSRVKFLRQKVRDLLADPEKSQSVESIVVVISILTNHARLGGLTTIEIDEVFTAGESILKAQKIQKGRSQLGFIYSYLYTAYAQCLRQMGKHWDAIWHQLQSDRNLDKAFGITTDNASISNAVRALRLGYVDWCKDELKKISFENLQSRNQFQYIMVNLSLDRLSGSDSDLTKIWQLAEKMVDATDSMRQELEWERMLRSDCDDKLRKMRKMVGSRGSHFAPSYILEYMGWVFASNKTKEIEKLKKVNSLKKHPGLDFNNSRILSTAMESLQDAYDTTIPFEVRLEKIGKLLVSRQRFLRIDSELLVLVGCFRWLYRKKSYTLSKLALSEYRKLSLSLSNGSSRDVLHLLSDLDKQHLGLVA